MEAKIKEIFSSIQGEGPVVGYKQLFVRFCGCNLNCDYCDTDFSYSNEALSFNPQELFEYLKSNYDLKSHHSISLTGGEPLLQSDFLKEFLPLIHPYIKIYLETNATLTDKFEEIKEHIDIVSADIKLKSSTGTDTFALHDKFLNSCSGVYTFAKVVFDSNIIEDEIDSCIKIVKDKNIELILQPKMNGNVICVSSDFCSEMLNKFSRIYPNVRLIPQVHKFLNVE